MTAHAHIKQHMPLRKFNRAVYNRLAKLIAGKVLYALVEHRGRKSGKIYTTPVIAHLHQGYVYIPLPYGDDTDWFLNLRAAGGCRLQYQGCWYAPKNPQVIDAEQALPVFSAYYRNAFKFFKVLKFLRMEYHE